MSKYGFSYLGSKNYICDELLKLFPPAKNFYDLFGVGGAVSHAVIKSAPKKFGRIIYNDLGDVARALVMTSSDYNDLLHNFVTPEEYKEIMSRPDKSPRDAAALCAYSFQGTKSYVYNTVSAELYKGYFDLVQNGDSSFFDGIGISKDNFDESHIEQIYSKYFFSKYSARHISREEFAKMEVEFMEAIRGKLNDARKKSNVTIDYLCTYYNNRSISHYFSRSHQMLPSVEMFIKLGRKMQLPFSVEEYSRNIGWYKLYRDFWHKYSFNFRLPNIEKLKQIYKVATDFYFSGLEIRNLDYRDVKIEPDSVVYCDIPYENTQNGNYAKGFRHAEFLDWAARQDELVLISSYCIRDKRFAELASIEKTSCINNKPTTEKVYIAKKNIGKYAKMMAERI